MDFVLTLGTAATATSLIVALVKMACPTAPSYVIVLAAVIAGIGLSFLVAIGQGSALTGQTIATSILAGVFAAASAAGVNKFNNTADEKRSPSS